MILDSGLLFWATLYVFTATKMMIIDDINRLQLIDVIKPQRTIDTTRWLGNCRTRIVAWPNFQYARCQCLTRDPLK